MDRGRTSDEMEQGTRQASSETDQLHSSHWKLRTWQEKQVTAAWACSKDADLTGDLPDSKSTSGGVLCIFESFLRESIRVRTYKSKTKTPRNRLLMYSQERWTQLAHSFGLMTHQRTLQVTQLGENQCNLPASLPKEIEGQSLSSSSWKHPRT